MTTVNIPDFYLALVLSDARREPTEQEYDEFLQQTQRYFLKNLQEKHKSVESLDLQLSTKAFGTCRPEKKFHVYIELSPVATVVSTPLVPTPEDLFKTITKGKILDFISVYVRQVNPDSPFASAIEVQGRRLKEATAGGVVQAPAFYVALVVPEEANTQPPTSDEIEQFVERTLKFTVKKLKLAYGGFLSVDMKVREIKLDFGHPEEQFNLYIQMDAIAKFSSDPPHQVSLLNEMGHIVEPEYIYSLHEIANSPFSAVSLCTLQPCVFVDIPPLDEAASDENLQNGSGDGSCSDKAETLVRCEFYVSYVLDLDSPGATGPTKSELETFERSIHKYFHAVLRQQYNYKFTRLNLIPDGPKYGKEAGLPEDHFNMLNRYKAEISFMIGSPPPTQWQVVSSLVESDMGALLVLTRKLPASCFAKASEVTMGRVLYKNDGLDKAFGGAINLEADRKRRAALEEATKREAEKEAIRQQELARKREEDRATKQAAELDKKRLQEELDRQAQEIVARVAAEEEKKRRDEVVRHAQELAAQRAAEEGRKHQEELEARLAVKAERKRQTQLERAAKKAAEEEKAQQEELDRQAQEIAARVAAEEEKKRRDEVARHAQELAAQKAAEEGRKRQEERGARLAAQAERKVQTEPERAARNAAEEGRKRQEELAARLAADASDRERKRKEAEAAGWLRKDEFDSYVFRVKPSDLYTSYALDDVEPTQTDYDLLVERSQPYFEKYLRKVFDNFVSLDLKIRRAIYGHGKPLKRFNVYVEWDIGVRFSSSISEVPDTVALSQALVESNRGHEYIRDVIHTMEGTPFATAISVCMMEVKVEESGIHGRT